MLKPELITQLGQQIIELLPESAKQTQQDMEKNVRSLLQSGFAKLDLVTREEFDAQNAVLQRTREKIDILEALVAQLETQLAGEKKEGTS